MTSCDLTWTPRGVGPVRVGMTRLEAQEALKEFGQPRTSKRGGGTPGWMVERPATIYVVEVIEFASPACFAYL